MPKYEHIAAQFCEHIRTIAAKEDNLNNFESYLSYHFAEWLNQYASTPADITSELHEFANMEI